MKQAERAEEAEEAWEPDSELDCHQLFSLSSLLRWFLCPRPWAQNSEVDFAAFAPTTWRVHRERLNWNQLDLFQM